MQKSKKATVKAPTMQDIADRAGLSRSAVSRALRGHPSIPAATRKKIEKIAAQLGYMRNPMITALMTNLRMARMSSNAPVIAYISSHPPSVDWRANPTLHKMYTGAKNRAEELGFRLEEFSGTISEGNFRRLSHILTARGISAILLGPRPHDTTPPLHFDWRQFSVVALGTSLSDLAIATVRHNHFEGMNLTFSKILECGHRRIGFYISKLADETNRHRWSASFLSSQQNIAPRDRVPYLRVPGDISSSQSERQFQAWFRKYRPTAIIVPWGNLRPVSWKQPIEIAHASLSYSPQQPEISGVYQRPADIGAASVDLLAAKLYHNERGLSSHLQEIVLSGEWVEGTSLRF